MIDLQVKKGVKNGDPTAFKEVFRLLYPRLLGYCALFITNKQQVEDIIQESFLALWEKRDTIKTDSSIESLLFVMVKNRCLNLLKKKKFEDLEPDLDSIQINEIQFLYQLDFTKNEDKSLEEQVIESFQQAVEELPEKMKVVFKKCKIEGIKQKEIAEELGISVKAIEKHISKAKKQIKNKLFKQYPTLTVFIALLFENLI